MYRLGIDIGGTKINIGVFDSKKNLIDLKKIYISEISDFVNDIYNSILNICNSLKIKISDISSCGVGIPGTVDKAGKKIIKAPNIFILPDNFVELLEKKLKIPVRAVQDSRAAAWGEFIIRDDNVKSLICVSVGTGIGTGIILDGKIYDGALGCAGELGHIPIKENGRKCGCGKYGCLEKYCAGGGLDITAKELLGNEKNASDLFEEAKCGNKDAKKAIDDAVATLGKALVSAVNLLSPDCLLISGGLSNQEELYCRPLIDYVKNHCYKTDMPPIIKKAILGELSPLFGAAFIPCAKNHSHSISASIMCADILHMEKAIRDIENAGIEYIHCDIMDQHFVPNLMLPPQLLNKLHSCSHIPFDYHLMTENPEKIIDNLMINKGDIVSVHYESTPHLMRVISQIKEKGASVGIALNPSTPIEMLSEVLEEIDVVLIMTVNPGFSGQKIVPSSFEKIKRMKSMILKRNHEYIKIEVDGNCSFENAPKMHKAGADILVAGTSSVFSSDISISEGTEKLRKCIELSE